MAVESAESKISFADITGAIGTEFPFGFKFFRKEDIDVRVSADAGLTETVLALDSDFEITPVSDDYPDGASVKLLTVQTAGSSLVISRVLELKQETSLPLAGQLNTESLEEQLDKIVMLCQQLQDQVDRAMVLPVTYEGSLSPITFLASVIASAAAAAADAASALASKDAAHDSEVSAAASAALAGQLSNVPLKATGAELDAGTDDEKFANPKAIKDSHNVPSVAPGTAGNVMTSNGTDWVAGSAPEKRWTVLTGCFTATPASTSTLTMTADKSATLPAALPLRYTIGGVTYIGQVVSCTSNLLTVRGARLSGDVTKLEYGIPGMVGKIDFFISGTYGNGTDTDLLWNDMNTDCIWDLPDAYFVYFAATQKTVDSGAEPKVNLNIAGNALSINNSNKGIQLTTSKANVANPAVAINEGNYKIVRGNAITPACTEAGGTGDAADLRISATFIVE